ncbi:MAG: LysR family transcriptional regulator [Bdellovibrionaceae bacterium]|nr:LysR family transcriptional regulator [Pseudobdellovibrionaceae bacterium]
MDLNLLNTFVTVIESGSMTQAAVRLKQPISRVSRAIARLEKELGLHLVLRTTRSFQVTAAGRRLFREVQPMMRQIVDLSRSIKSESEELVGLVRMTAPEDFGQFIMAPIVAELGVIHPGLQLEMNFTDEFVDLVRTETDIGIRGGKLKDSTLKAKYLGKSVFRFVAAPSYVDKYGYPKRPQDLIQHRCIYSPLGSMSQRTEWIVTNGQREERIQFVASWKVNHKRVALDLAKAGLGITMLPVPLVKNYIEEKELVPILPTWTLPPAPIHLVYPPRQITAAKVRVVSAFLEKKLKPLLMD